MEAGTTSHSTVNLLVVTINRHDSNMKLTAKAENARLCNYGEPNLPAQTLLRQILAGEAVQKQAGSESLRIGPGLVSCSITRLRSNTLLISTPSSTKKLQNIQRGNIFEVRFVLLKIIDLEIPQKINVNDNSAHL